MRCWVHLKSSEGLAMAGEPLFEASLLILVLAVDGKPQCLSMQTSARQLD